MEPALLLHLRTSDPCDTQTSAMAIRGHQRERHIGRADPHRDAYIYGHDESNCHVDPWPATQPPPAARHPRHPPGRRAAGPAPGRARKPKRRAGAPGKARPEHTRNTHGTHTEHTRNAPGRELQPRRSESKRGARRDRSAPPASLRPAKSGRKTPTPIFYG